MIARAAPQRRRPGPDEHSAERYRALARGARRRRVVDRRPLYALLAWPLMIALGFVVLARTVDELGVGLGSLASDVGLSIASAFPTSEPQTLEVDRTVGAAAAPDPIIDGLPAFTNVSQLTFQGRVPSFALGADRQIEIALNGQKVATVPLDSLGRFSAPLLLREGVNDISTALLRGSDVVASVSSSVIFDRTAPALSLVRPKAGDEIADASAVTVEGKAEPNARVLVNDRQVLAAPDGSFSETFTAAPGALTINVVARDQAGNETKTQVAVTVKARAVPATGIFIGVGLDRAKVRPGEPVVADIVVIESGRAREGLTVTLQVGVITVGSSKTNAQGFAKIGFAAPTSEGEIAVVALGGDTSGRATLTVAR